MKKIIAMMLALILALSLCACSGTYVNENGETIHVKDGEVVLDVSGEFTVTKIEKSVYYIKNSGARNEYTAVLQNDQYTFIVSVNARHYALWEIGDTVAGQLVATYRVGYDDTISTFKMPDDATLAVDWYGKTE